MRYLPYGYRITDGQYTVQNDEADVVRNVYSFYRNGASYKEIAAMLNRSNCPPYGDSPWSKNHIKRMLENERYIGYKGFPIIIELGLYKQARQVHDGKIEKYTAPSTDESKVLWKKLICGECGKRLLRNGSRASTNGIIQLRCENPNCSNRLDIPKMKLSEIVLLLQRRLLDEECGNPQETYSINGELLRLTNLINAGIARPDDPSKISKLILRCVTERYKALNDPGFGLPATIQYDKPRLHEIDWKLLEEAVSYISLSPRKADIQASTGRTASVELQEGV